MTLAMSPPPQVEYLQEPPPTDSDDDMVPNDPANFPPLSTRKRKISSQKGSQTANKRQRSSLTTQNSSRTTNLVGGSSHRSKSPSSSFPAPQPSQNSTTFSSRNTNAVAGSSRRLKSPSSRAPAPQASSSSKVKQSRHTMSQSATEVPRTKVIRRTRKEKQRQRSSSTDTAPEPPPTLRSLVQDGLPLPSASAPAPKRQTRAFERDALQNRFSRTQSAPKPRRKVSSTAEIIEITSDEEPPPGRTKPTVRPPPPANDPDVIDIPDTESESEIRKKSAARKSQKGTGVKNWPLEGREVVEISDSDDEPPPPRAKPEVAPKVEDAPIGPSGDDSAPTPDENELNFDPDDGMDLDFGGGEDVMRDVTPPRSPSPKSPLSGTRAPPAIQTPPLENSAMNNGPPQRVATPPAATSPDINDMSNHAGTSHAPEAVGDVSQADSPEQQRPVHSPIVEGRPSTPPQDHSPDFSGVAPLDTQRVDVPSEPRSPVSPKDSNAEEPKSTKLFLPNGLLSSHAEDDAPDLGKASRKSPGPPSHAISPSLPTQKPPLPLPRRGVPTEGKDVLTASRPASPPVSPYKSIRDSAMRTSAANLQRQLGLQGKPDAPVLPKLDLRSLPVRHPLPSKKRPPQARAVTPPSLSLTPDPTLESNPPPEQSAGPSGSTRLPSPQPSPKKKPLPRKQSSLVDAIIMTGQHNARSSTALSQAALPSRRPPSSASASPAPPPTQPSIALSQPSLPPRRPPSPPSASPSENPPSAPPPATLKQEEVLSAATPTLVGNFIDLTISDDDEPKTPQAPTQASVPAAGSVVSPVPVGPQEDPAAVRARAARRLQKLMSKHGPSKSSGSLAASAPADSASSVAKSPPITEGAPVDMDVDSPAGGAPVAPNEEHVLEQGSESRLDGPPAPDDAHHSPPPSLVPPEDDAAKMDVDNIPAPVAPPDALPAAIQVRYTDVVGMKLSNTVRRWCFNCHARETTVWRRSNLSPSKILCNKCGVFERTHLRPRPEGGWQSEQELGASSAPLAPAAAESALAGPSQQMPVDVAEPETVPAAPQESDASPVNPTGQDTKPHPTSSDEPPLERRSYDDTEVYHLEYFGPPSPAPNSRSESEEVAVEDLVAPSSCTYGGPAQGDMDADVRASDDDSSSSGPSQDAFLEASGDDDEGSAFALPLEPPLRRSSRRSSRSSSADPLNFIGQEDEDNLDFNTPVSPMSPNDSVIPQDLLTSPLPTSENGTFDDWLPTPRIRDETVYPVITWESYRQDLSNFQPRVYYARDLVSLLHDYINSYDEYFRSSPNMRLVFESAIRANTAEDEPDAPQIQVVNMVDHEPCPPWEFYYTNKIWLGEEIDPPDITQLVGCDCKGKCNPKSTTCSCVKRQSSFYKELHDPGFAYDNKGRLRVQTGIPIFECNALCSCDDDECKNRVVQHGRKCSVNIQKTPNKGWGVFAPKKIQGGTFIGVYSGEFLRDDVSESRGLVYDKSGRTYLLDIDFYHLKELGDCQYVVDAYHAGNFTRFLNNSCDPNCKVTPCYINEPDIQKPLLTLFATRDIAPGEELCFSYSGYDPNNPDEDEGKGANSIKNKCYCGAAKCTGYMFG